MIFLPPTSPANELLAALDRSLAAGSREQVDMCFQRPADAAYLIDMAGRRGGLKALKAAIIPAPPGWQSYGEYLAIVHTPQMIEEDHDPLYKVVTTPAGLRLGQEIAEDDLAGWRIADQSYSAKLYPNRSRVDVSVTLHLKRGTAERAPIFRLNDNYGFGSAAVTATDTQVAAPKPGQLVRAGSLLIPWTSNPARTYTFSYSAVLPQSNDDEITPSSAYVTGWWLPSLGRLPFTVEGQIDAPADWTVRGEGFRGKVVKNGDRTISRFSCPLPISYPKVIGGKYTLMAEKKVEGQDFRIYQVDPTDAKRANHDLEKTIEAALFYDKTLGRLPFNGYECYDATRFYGIESYSHTLLQRNVTHFISHEMGHTYFGGTAPCPYVHDSWNEGVTEYIDSVVLLHDEDHSLENALRTLGTHVPLSDMPIPWNYGSATYWRGCYVMKMLESEIGPDKVLSALRNIAQSRRGQDTRWSDLLPYFEKAGGQKLDWFWSQWVDGADFPTLKIKSSETAPAASGLSSKVVVAQSGTPHPYRLRFVIEVKVGDKTIDRQVQLLEGQSSFTIDTPTKPDHVKLLVFPYTLATVQP